MVSIAIVTRSSINEKAARAALHPAMIAEMHRDAGKSVFRDTDALDDLDMCREL